MPLEIGLTLDLHIREEHLSTRHDACRLLYISDIHLRRSRSDRLSRQVLASVARCHPDAVLLGGDLVDRSSELIKLTELVGTLREIAPVFAVAGNHDYQVGIDLVSEAVTRGGGQWIHGHVARLSHRGRVIAIAGPESAPPADGDVRVLCGHHPRIWKAARTVGFDLVLAGHLHGCQVVAGEFRGHLLPGALFYGNCVLSHHHDSTRLVVSRGVSDLVPVRWQCPREVVLCHV